MDRQRSPSPQPQEPDPEHHSLATLAISSASKLSLAPADDGAASRASSQSPVAQLPPPGSPTLTAAFARAKALALETTAKLRGNGVRLSELGSGGWARSESGGGLFRKGRTADAGAGSLGTSAGSSRSYPVQLSASEATVACRSFADGVGAAAGKPPLASPKGTGDGAWRPRSGADGTSVRKSPGAAREVHNGCPDAEDTFVDVDVLDDVLQPHVQTEMGPTSRKPSAPGPQRLFSRNPAAGLVARPGPLLPFGGEQGNEQSSLQSPFPSYPRHPEPDTQVGHPAALRVAVSFGDLIGLSSSASDSVGRAHQEPAGLQEPEKGQ